MLPNSVAPWTGRILHVDLSSETSEIWPSDPYVYAYLGGRGLASRLAWDLVKPGMGPYDPESPLMFMPGALVGTPAPSSGRVNICGLSPQSHPHEWYTRASLGGHWGATLRYAGYDGLVVTGRASRPVYLRIEDDSITFCEAGARRNEGPLWGRGLIETQLVLCQELGDDWRTLAIGPAGENRCRYAIVATGTESAAGQGGFGAVMGSKHLKAIAVRSRGGVSIARPAEMLRRSRKVVARVQARYGHTPTSYGGGPSEAGEARPSPCTFQCPGSCGGYYRDVPGVIHPERTYSGQLFCCAPRFKGGSWLGADFGYQAAFELAQVANDLGLNHWELTFGLAPWMVRVRDQLPTELRGIDLADLATWHEVLHKVAYREDWGDLLAEGGPRVSQALGVGGDVIGRYYPAWGHASHWDGHGSFGSPYFPFWLVTALQWALDSRDPLGGGHGFTTNIVGLIRRIGPPDGPLRWPTDGNQGAAEAWRKLGALGERVYGSAEAVDPRSGYKDKAIPAVFHQDRNALKDSLGICDNIFPLLADPGEPDYAIQLDGVDGRFLEHYLFEPASGLELTPEAFYRVGTRVFTLERMLAIRNWGRSRATDETIIPYLKQPEASVNPFVGHKVDLDETQFRGLLDACYELRGWDPKSGQPTEDTLRALDLTKDDLVAP